MNAERWLKVVLLLFGVPAALAIFPLLMPFDWMAAVHARLGMGELPEKPIVDYLARYASAFSALYGIVLILLSTDVRRYAPVITLQAVTVIVLSTLAAIFGFRAGMPWWWMVGDLASCWFACGAMLFLQTRIPHAPGLSA